MNKTLVKIIAATALGLSTGEIKAEQLPLFEPNHTDFTHYWTHGGQKIGWNGGAQSAWSFSHNPIDSGNGVEMRIVGPQSGGSYGAEAWVKTTMNFNDGNDWLINFSWNAVRRDQFSNRLQLQITDGYIDPSQFIYWECRDIPGTTNLLTDKDIWGLNDNNSNYFMFLAESMGIWAETLQNYSLEISPNGKARLFNAYDLKGNLLTEKTLDKNYPWYFRVMAKDATSAGIPAGDFSINVHDVSATQVPEPSTSMLLITAGVLGAGYLAYKKK
jgi:hypothetical protein